MKKKDNILKLLEYQYLYAELRYHKYRYYILNDASLPDYDYDITERRFNKLARENGWPGSWVGCRDAREEAI